MGGKFMSFQEDLKQKLKNYIRERDFMHAAGISRRAKLEFLAQGEYNINYLIKDEEEKYVLRVNLGSQMHLDDQIGYEFSALQALAPSGVTPRPFYLDNSQEKIDYGLLMMEYLPGRSLDYQKDLKTAAKIFAKIHKLDSSKAERLVQEKKPLTAIWNECEALLEHYFNSELAVSEIKKFLMKMKAEMYKKKEKESELMELFPPAIVNTEVNSNNFILWSQLPLSGKQILFLTRGRKKSFYIIILKQEEWILNTMRLNQLSSYLMNSLQCGEFPGQQWPGWNIRIQNEK
ncbi:MAG: Choline kinase [Halanaerobium sp.]|nr:MAG: Choline kinase [Halanaerobium sp.]